MPQTLKLSYADITRLFMQFEFFYGQKWRSRYGGRAINYYLCEHEWYAKLNSIFENKNFYQNYARYVLRDCVDECLRTYIDQPPTLPEFLKILRNN